MNKLEAKMNKRDKAIKKKAELKGIPLFEPDGSVKKEKKSFPKKTVISISIIILILSIIYLPGVFIKETDDNPMIIAANVDGIKNTSNCAKNYPDADFDNDGLPNSLENKYGTSPRREDTDGDGVSDYAELFITDTDPNVFDDGLFKAVEKQDAEQGNSVSDPYKIHNVVLWPEDMESRVYGGVVRTKNGYRFCSFSGWAQFPEGKYAYKIENGVHVALKHREQEDAWYINDENEIILTEEPLETIYSFRIAGIGTYYISNNIFGKILSTILPEKGLITCKTMTTLDIDNSAVSTTTAPIVNIDYDKNDLNRYGENQLSLTNLASVYASIDEGSSVLVSLNSQESGEVIAEIYGYFDDGNLLVADAKTLKPIGILYITEKSGRFLGEDGKLTYKEWYEFKGLGFDSIANNDRINFFAAAIPQEGIGNVSIEETSEPVEEESTQTPEILLPENEEPVSETKSSEPESQME